MRIHIVRCGVAVRFGEFFVVTALLGHFAGEADGRALFRLRRSVNELYCAEQFVEILRLGGQLADQRLGAFPGRSPESR